MPLRPVSSLYSSRGKSSSERKSTVSTSARHNELSTCQSTAAPRYVMSEAILLPPGISVRFVWYET